MALYSQRGLEVKSGREESPTQSGLTELMPWPSILGTALHLPCGLFFPSSTPSANENIAPRSAHRRAPDPKKTVRVKPGNDPATFFFRPSCQVIGRPWDPLQVQVVARRIRPYVIPRGGCEMGSLPSEQGLFLGQPEQNLK